jgi:TPR repeat protein
LYHEGKGVKQDYAEALKWLRRSADQGNFHAQFNLGFMYEQGEGVERDLTVAKEWYKKAAQSCFRIQERN